MDTGHNRITVIPQDAPCLQVYPFLYPSPPLTPPSFHLTHPERMHHVLGSLLPPSSASSEEHVEDVHGRTATPPSSFLQGLLSSLIVDPPLLFV